MGAPTLTMTLPTGKRPTPGVEAARGSAFTLVELLLVMALLTIVIGISAPTLSRFFRGRTLEVEANRVLALTRYGQSQAVSAGLPLVLWIDRVEGTYGLREQMGYYPGVRQLRERETSQNLISDEKSWEYKLDKNLRFELPQNERLTNGVGTIRFAPDGTIEESSLPCLLIEDQDKEVIPIIQSRNRLRYEIAAKTNEWYSTNQWFHLRR
jgi:Tfp pilus assembly protein FimT